MLFDRLAGVFRAARIEATGWRQSRRNPLLVEANRGQEDLFHDITLHLCWIGLGGAQRPATFEQSDARLLNGREVHRSAGRSSDPDDVPARRYQVPAQAHRLADAPADTIAFNGLAETPAHRDPGPADRQAVRQQTQHQQWVRVAGARLAYQPEAFFVCQPMSPFHLDTISDRPSFRRSGACVPGRGEP